MKMSLSIFKFFVKKRMSNDAIQHQRGSLVGANVFTDFTFCLLFNIFGKTVIKSFYDDYGET